MEFQNPLAHLPSWATHLLLWLGIWLALFFLMSGLTIDPLFIQRVTLVVVIQMLLAYWNMYVLIPRFLFRKQYFYYFLASLLSIVLLAYTFWLAEAFFELSPFGANRGTKAFPRDFKNPPNWKAIRFVGKGIPMFMTLIISTTYKTMGLANQREQEAALLKHEKLTAELKFLRSQINPHFLFNSLNNVYALSVIGSEKTSENLLKLSTMLRYMLYEANADLVPLSKELRYLKNYIDLQKLKDEEPINIDLDLEEPEGELLIPPMILIPFVENSFKHSNIEDSQNGWIKICLRATAHSFSFQISNSLPTSSYSKDPMGGIGLTNVEKRLALLYPGKHQLKIGRQADRYNVFLQIDLVETEKQNRRTT